MRKTRVALAQLAGTGLNRYRSPDLISYLRSLSRVPPGHPARVSPYPLLSFSPSSSFGDAEEVRCSNIEFFLKFHKRLAGKELKGNGLLLARHVLDLLVAGLLALQASGSEDDLSVPLAEFDTELSILRLCQVSPLPSRERLNTLEMTSRSCLQNSLKVSPSPSLSREALALPHQGRGCAVLVTPSMALSAHTLSVQVSVHSVRLACWRSGLVQDLHSVVLAGTPVSPGPFQSSSFFFSMTRLRSGLLVCLKGLVIRLEGSWGRINNNAELPSSACA
ncbi:hypothetical protein ABBQ32_003735 [Trebouxia sp. C0010 RCD-2024]